MEGSVSQISDLGPSYYFMQSRKKVSKNDKSIPFLTKLEIRPKLKIRGTLPSRETLRSHTENLSLKD